MGTTDKAKIWFHAKTYGWGWGSPASWQGWVVLVAYVWLFVGGILVFPPHQKLAYFLAYVAALNALLIAVCWWKGEEPRWRWGERTTSPVTADRRGLLLLHLLMGPLLLTGAIYFRTHLPPDVNGAYGHRTPASMRSPGAWDAAQRFSADAMIVAAVITLAYQAVSCFTMKPAISLATSVIVLIVLLLAGIVATELYLARHFDADGKLLAEPPTSQSMAPAGPAEASRVEAI
jgi:uncharacterized membrane protein